MNLDKCNFNYRIFKRSTKSQTFFSLHEVYYDKNGVVCGWTEEPINELHLSVAELLEDLERILSDAKKHQSDILNYDETPLTDF